MSTLCRRALFVLGLAVVLPPLALVTTARSESPLLLSAAAQSPSAAAFSATAPALSRPPLQRPAQPPRSKTAVAVATPAIPAALVATAPASSGLIAAITLADIGFVNGLRFANLGGRREIFVPVPHGDADGERAGAGLDDVSAHDARRNLEVQVNDRTAPRSRSTARAAVVPSACRWARPSRRTAISSCLFSIPALRRIDRCIDVRSVGDSLTIRPETAIEH